MPCSKPIISPMPAWTDEPEPLTTAALLRERFGDVLIPLDDVRKAYFRNRSADRFRRALREGVIYDLMGRLSHEDVRERTISALQEGFWGSGGSRRFESINMNFPVSS